jgi:hypothetical protein
VTVDFFCNLVGSAWWYRFRADDDDQLVDRLSDLAGIVAHAADRMGGDPLAEGGRFKLYFLHNITAPQYPDRAIGIYVHTAELDLNKLALCPADVAREMMAKSKALWHLIDHAMRAHLETQGE